MEGGLHIENISVPPREYTVECKAANILVISVANLLVLYEDQTPELVLARFTRTLDMQRFE